VEATQSGLRIEVGDVYREAWDALKSTLGATGAILGIAVGAGFLVPVAIMAGGFAASGVLAPDAMAEPNPDKWIPVGIAGIVALLIYGVVFIGCYGAANALYLDALRGRPTSVGSAMARGFSRFPSLFAAGLLTAMAIVVGYMMCCVPGIILSFGLVLVYPIIVEEDSGPIDGMQRSWNLMDGHKVDMFLILLVLGGLGLGVTLIGAIVNQIVTGGAAFNPQAPPQGAEQWVPIAIGQIIQMLLAFFLFPLRVAVCCAAYTRRTQPLSAPAADVARVFT
jgi:uncharacterized membrane protein